MINRVIQTVLKNRFTLLASVLTAYMLLLSVENLITGRTPDLLHFDNSLFELQIGDWNELDDMFE